LELVDTLLSTQFTQNSILLLKNNIRQHNSDYILLFQDNLKPKHHLLTHYPTIILNSGPPKHFWCFRYEAKHKEMKIYVHVITSRKNISLTLAKKFQYKFINNILNNYPDECVKEMRHKICTNHNPLIQRNLGLSIDEFDCYSQVELKGTTYKVGYLVSNFTDELCLYEILEIVLVKINGHIKFIVNQVQIENYNSHLKAYRVNNINNFKYILSPKNCSGPPININKTFKGDSMIRLKEYY